MGKITPEMIDKIKKSKEVKEEIKEDSLPKDSNTTTMCLPEPDPKEIQFIEGWCQIEFELEEGKPQTLLVCEFGSEGYDHRHSFPGTFYIFTEGPGRLHLPDISDLPVETTRDSYAVTCGNFSVEDCSGVVVGVVGDGEVSDYLGVFPDYPEDADESWELCSFYVAENNNRPQFVHRKLLPEADLDISGTSSIKVVKVISGDASVYVTGNDRFVEGGEVFVVDPQDHCHISASPEGPVELVIWENCSPYDE